MFARDALSEAHLNKVLRRVDWRFLLRDPRSRTSICFGDDHLAEAVAAISDQVKTAGSEPRADCDLAVATNPDAKTLKAAWAALKPGGALYTEWSVSIVGYTRRVQRVLQSAGFQDVHCYWAWPLPDRSPLFWAPLDARGARSAWRYLLASRPPDRHRLRHWVRWLLRVMAYSAHTLGLLMPVSAIAYKPGEEHRSSLMDWLQAHWLDWQLGSPPDELSLLLLTSGKRSINKVVALAFAEPDPQPRLVVKMPRVAESVQGLKHEAAMLEAVHARRTTAMRGVPQIVFCEEHDTYSLLGETALNGVPLFTQLNRHNYRAWALKATDWLIELAGDAPSVARDQWWSRLIEPVLRNFDESFGPILDQRDLKATRRILAQVEALPPIIEQRDFSPWNVLISTDDELMVLDWESAELDGLPLVDLIYFLTYLAFFVEDAMETGRFVEAYQKCWSEQTVIGQVNAECLKRYCAALRLDDACVPALRLFTWLLHSRSERARLMADAGGKLPDEALRQSTFVRLWEEEVRCGYAGART